MAIFFNRYFTCPRPFFPLIAQLKTVGELKVALFLWSEMARLQKPHLRFKYEDIKAKTECAFGTIGKALPRLKELGFIDTLRGTGGVYHVWMLDPFNGKLCERHSRPIKTFEDTRQKMRDRQEQRKNKRPENSTPAVAFDFGYNRKHGSQSSSEQPVEESEGLALDFSR